MKRMFIVLMVLLMVTAAGSAMASGNNTLTVSASVTGTCKFVSGTSTLNFGALDPSSSSDATGSGTTTFWCTKGVTTDSITAGNGANWSGTSRQIKDAVSGDLIPYSLSLTKDGSANAGPSSPRTLTIDGTILNADYVSKSAGSYSDTVTLSITP